MYAQSSAERLYPTSLFSRTHTEHVLLSSRLSTRVSHLRTYPLVVALRVPGSQDIVENSHLTPRPDARALLRDCSAVLLSSIDLCQDGLLLALVSAQFPSSAEGGASELSTEQQRRTRQEVLKKSSTVMLFRLQTLPVREAALLV